MPSLPIDPDDAPSIEDEDVTVGQESARVDAIRALREAFPARRRGRFEPFVISERGREPSEVEEILGPVEDWTTIDVAGLDSERLFVTSCLAFLSDEAVCFYLPAFLIAGLRGECVMGPPNFWLTHSFQTAQRDERLHGGETREDGGRRRWAALTVPQVRAVGGYLEWWLLLNGVHGESEIVEAFDRYWRPRAAAGRG